MRAVTRALRFVVFAASTYVITLVAWPLGAPACAWSLAGVANVICKVVSKTGRMEMHAGPRQDEIAIHVRRNGGGQLVAGNSTHDLIARSLAFFVALLIAVSGRWVDSLRRLAWGLPLIGALAIARVAVHVRVCACWMWKEPLDEGARALLSVLILDPMADFIVPLLLVATVLVLERRPTALPSTESGEADQPVPFQGFCSS